jgi:two-component system cell cycle response regulator DivK
MPYKVLIVDGDAHSLLVLSALLTTLKIGFKRNTSGTNVVEQARKLHPDAIVLNMQLPDADAAAICHDLKADSALASIPIIAISDDTAAETVKQAKSCGCVALIHRPIPRQAFGNYLLRLLNSGGRSIEYPG